MKLLVVIALLASTVAHADPLDDAIVRVQDAPTRHEDPRDVRARHLDQRSRHVGDRLHVQERRDLE